jgi:hypothetical protein
MPQIQKPLKPALANEWLDSKNGTSQWNQRTSMKRLCLVINVFASIQFSFQLSNNSKKSIVPVTSSLPPSKNKSNQARDKSADHCCYSFGAHFLLANANPSLSPRRV